MKHKATTITLIIIVILLLSWMASRQIGKNAFAAGLADGKMGEARSGWPNYGPWASVYMAGNKLGLSMPKQLDTTPPAV